MWGWPWARETPKNFGLPIIFMQRLKLAPSNLVRIWNLSMPWARKLPDILRFHFDIYTMAEARDF